MDQAKQIVYHNIEHENKNILFYCSFGKNSGSASEFVRSNLQWILSVALVFG